MEAIGAASAIVSLVEVTAEVLEAGYKYIRKVVKAPSEIKSLLGEVAGIYALLDEIQNLHDESTSIDQALTSLVKNGHLLACEESLNEAKQTIDKCTRVDGESMKNMGKRLAYPFKEDKILDLLAKLERNRKRLAEAINIDTRAAVRRVEVATGEIDSKLSGILEESHSQKLLDWLCPYPDVSTERHAKALAARTTGTGNWLTDSDDFKTLYCKSELMWVAGPAGSGKTILVANAIDHLQRTVANSTLAVAYYYLDSNASSEDTPQKVLAALVRQIVLQKPTSLNVVDEIYQLRNRDGPAPIQANDYVTIFHKLAAKFEATFFFIDGLDEAEDSIELLSTLNSIMVSGQQSYIQSRIISSRTNPKIEVAMQHRAQHIIKMLNNSMLDLRLFIDTEVDEKLQKGLLKLRDPDLAGTIKKEVMARSGGLFLQARFHIDHVSRSKNDRAVKRALEHLPSALNSTYEQALCRIKEEDDEAIEEAKRMLLWLAYAEEPLTTFMLAEAAAIGEDDTTLDKDAVATDPEDLVSVLGSLVAIEKRQGKRTAKVDFSHLSVYEYLHSEALKDSPLASDFYIPADTGDRYLAKTCAQYLGFKDFSTPVLSGPKDRQGRDGRVFDDPRYARRRPPYGSSFHRYRNHTPPQLRIEERLLDYPLMRYAAKHWPKHVQRASKSSLTASLEKDLETHLDWFLSHKPGSSELDNYASWHEIHHRYCDIADDCEWDQSPWFFSIVLGLDICFDKLFDKNNNVNTRFAGGWTPLTAAIVGGSLHIIRRLLDAGANVNFSAGLPHGRNTALHLAAEKGDLDMTKLLLEYNASVTVITYSKTTPLYRATRSGNMEVMEALYAAGSDVNALTYDHWTPLMEPTMRGDAHIVKKLLEWGSDPLIENAHGTCPMDVAWEGNYRDVWAMFTRKLEEQSRLEEYRTRVNKYHEALREKQAQQNSSILPINLEAHKKDLQRMNRDLDRLTTELTRFNDIGD